MLTFARSILTRLFLVAFLVSNFLLILDKESFAKEVLTLEDLILLSVQHNPQIQIATKVKEQYTFQKEYIKAGFFPYLYLQYQYQRVDKGKNFPTVEEHAFGPYVVWNLFSGFSTWHSYKGALKQILAKDHQVKETALEVSLSVIQAYLDYFKQKALYEAALADLEDAKTILKLAKKRHEVGLSPYADVLDAEAKVKQAEFNVTNYKYTSDIAKAKILTLINRDISKIEEFEILPPEEKPYEVRDFSYYINLGLSKRPEIKLKEAEMLAQEERLKSVKGEFFPKIDLFSSYYKRDSKFYPDREEEFIAGIKVNFSVFTGFERISKLGIERSILEQKKLEKVKTELDVKQEIFSNYKKLQTAKENYETSLVWLKSIEEDFRITKKKYETGLASIVDVTTVLARLSEARAQVAVSKYNFIYFYYALYRSAGVLPGLEL